MQGYVWAKTPENALFVVLIQDGKGFVPGVENGIDLDQFEVLEPVKWPSLPETPGQNSAPRSFGARAAAAMHVCDIIPFAARG
jgi:hypothetical protein